VSQKNQKNSKTIFAMDASERVRPLIGASELRRNIEQIFHVPATYSIRVGVQ